MPAPAWWGAGALEGVPMRQSSSRRRFGSVFVSSVLAVAATTAGLLVPAVVPLSAHAEDEGVGGIGGPAAPAEHEFLQKTVRGQTLPRHAYDVAAAQALEVAPTGGSWSLLGPANI